MERKINFFPVAKDSDDRWKRKLIKEIKETDLGPLSTAIDYNFSLEKDENGEYYKKNSLSVINLLEATGAKHLLLIVEDEYVDKLYRDSYYDLHSRRMKQMSSQCNRVSIIDTDAFLENFKEYSESNTSLEDRNQTELMVQTLKEALISPESKPILDNDEEQDGSLLFLSLVFSYGKVLEKSIIGCVVLTPFIPAPIGRILINPKKVKVCSGEYRTTDVRVTVLGKRIHINCYPYSGQDELHVSCAEVSLWSLFEYFGSRYPDYSNILPSRFVSEVISDLNEEREYPVRGLRVGEKSRILKNFGFFPKLYTREATDMFDEIFFTYLNSGIPLACSVSTYGSDHSHHAVVAVGYEAFTDVIHLPISMQKNFIGKDEKDEDKYDYLYYILPCNLINSYIFMDDANIPYMSFPLIDYDPTRESKNYIPAFIAPLHHGIMIDAEEAIKKFKNILHLVTANISDVFGISLLNTKPFLPVLDQELVLEKMLVTNIFVTSGSRFIDSRIADIIEENLENDDPDSFKEWQLKTSLSYKKLALPKFVWVMEISTIPLFTKKKVMAEVILDSTAIHESAMQAVIAIRVGSDFSYRCKKQKDPDEQKSSSKISPRFFKAYKSSSTIVAN